MKREDATQHGEEIRKEEIFGKVDGLYLMGKNKEIRWQELKKGRK